MNGLDEFFELKAVLMSRFNTVDIDEYGLMISSEKSMLHNADLHIFALTHGDEIIGIQIINKLLKTINNSGVPYTIAVTLNNVAAFRAQKRFVNHDLNRSFSLNSARNLEAERAGMIEKLMQVTRPRLILDLHQTIEPSDAPFAIMPESERLIAVAQYLTPQYPVVTFSTREPFSGQGKTLIEFAREMEIPAFVYELGQKSYNEQISDEICEKIMGLNIEKAFKSDLRRSNIWAVNHRIPGMGFKLVPNLRNFQRIASGDVLAVSETGTEFKAPESGVILFPRYSEAKAAESDLALIAVPRP